jgi:hypothetical protein
MYIVLSVFIFKRGKKGSLPCVDSMAIIRRIESELLLLLLLLLLAGEGRMKKRKKGLIHVIIYLYTYHIIGTDFRPAFEGNF